MGKSWVFDILLKRCFSAILFSVNGDKIGIAAAIGQGANPVAQLPLALAATKCNNFSRNLKAKKVRGPVGGR